MAKVQGTLGLSVHSARVSAARCNFGAILLPPGRLRVRMAGVMLKAIWSAGWSRVGANLGQPRWGAVGEAP